MMSRLIVSAMLLAGVGAERSGARGDDTSPAISVRLVRPDEQLERLIALFEGARSPHPAAALSAWKHASAAKSGLGKPLEAAIAALNPAMVRELRSIHDAGIDVRFDPGTGTVRWRARLPGDDGSLAALATALALTDGAIDAPAGDSTVLRLGPPGAPVSASLPGLFVVAGTRLDLVEGLAEQRSQVRPVVTSSGCHFQIFPRGLRSSASLSLRRLGEGLIAAGCQTAEGRLELVGETISLSFSCQVERPTRGGPIEPAWLDAVPASNTIAAFAVSIETAAEAFDTAFELADRVEKADPARAEVAPLRTRFNLLAAAARVRLEADFWPKLRGVSGFVTADHQGIVDGAVVLLHAVDGDAAKRIAGHVLPRLAASYGKPTRFETRDSKNQALLMHDGRPLIVSGRGPSVWIGWGERALEAGLEAAANQDKSAGRTIRSGWGAIAPQRAGAFWPGRLGVISAPGSALTTALAEAPPVLWVGRIDGRSSLDLVSWNGAREVLKRWLDELPLIPLPDR